MYTMYIIVWILYMSNKPAQGLSVINRLKRFSAFWTTNHSPVFNQKTSASSPVLPNVRPLFCVLSFFRYQPQIQIKGFTESFLQTLTDPECLKIFSINGSVCKQEAFQWIRCLVNVCFTAWSTSFLLQNCHVSISSILLTLP